jgi:hypothetical protein
MLEAIRMIAADPQTVADAEIIVLWASSVGAGIPVLNGPNHDVDLARGLRALAGAVTNVWRPERVRPAAAVHHRVDRRPPHCVEHRSAVRPWHPFATRSDDKGRRGRRP